MKNRPQLDPARALRLAVRHNEKSKVSSLVDWMLKRVPLIYVEGKHAIETVTVIRGSPEPGDDGFAFEVDASNVIRSIRRAHEMPSLGGGDRVVVVDGKELTVPLREAVNTESVASLGVWKRAAMASIRRQLAREALDDALLETGKCAADPWASDIAGLLLHVRASVRHTDANGLSPLHWAAHRGQADLTSLLLRSGAPVDGSEAVDGVGAKHTPLRMAVMGGHLSTVSLLLDNGADPALRTDDGRQLIHLAALGPCEGVLCEGLVELLVKRGRQQPGALSQHGWSPLFLAAGADNLHMVRAFVSLGTPIAEMLRGRTLLHHAAACDATDVLRWIATERGADLPLDAADAKGRTPLFVAARACKLRALQLLLDFGVNVLLDGERALELGVSDEDCKMMLGAAIRHARLAFSRALLAASVEGNLPQVRALHAQNADLLHYDERGFNSLHHAAVGAHEDIVLYLLQTPQGAALCNQSTAESGALSAWLPAQVAASERIRQQLLDFAQGGDEARRRLIQFARKKLRIQQRGGLEAQ